MKSEKAPWRIGYRIAKRRSDMGMTQEAFAESIGISRVSVVRIENGDQAPKLETVVQICEALHITPNELFPSYLSDAANIENSKELYERVTRLSPKNKEMFYYMAEIILRGIDGEGKQCIADVTK